MKLSDWLSENNLSAAEFGRSIGASRQNVARWVGGVIPRQDEMLAIVTITNGAVTPNDFFGVSRPSPNQTGAEQ